MDFDLSKENIQPLRGGRNVQQLGMALQAQSNREYQLELLQQKEEFDNLIRNYDGDDPLENYYNYISWIEQSYPKHGHEGNLVPLLEHCLSLFENDKRYTNDRRFCKLWIKYFDLQQNPLELYHMMRAKGLCCGCADLYRAWAYYYEAVGDFQSANNVFEDGKRVLAQPYEDLENAHQNLIMAAGQHVNVEIIVIICL
uniref:Mitotic checkpoint serine/threonine-protein kinase n=1 Tax=Anoplophora glabripennis TaxID=217634 RepID=V5GRK0_ANOGL